MRQALALSLCLAGCGSVAIEEMPPPQPLPGGDPLVDMGFANAAELRAGTAAEPGRLRPGDLVEVSVYGHPDLESKVRLGPAGAVTLPLIGETTLAGKSVAEAQESLRTAFEKSYLVHAPVRVLVVEYAQRTVFLLGSLKRPGAYPLPVEGPFTLLQALANAGGFETDADREGILLVRGGTDGKRRLYRLSYAAIEQEGRIEGDVPLVPGDALLVPGRGTITVLGSVTTAGVFTIPDEGMTILRAVAKAGGLTRFASPNRAVVIRRLPGGASVPVRIALGEIMAGERSDQKLRAGDVVYVPESLF